MRDPANVKSEKRSTEVGKAAYWSSEEDAPEGARAKLPKSVWPPATPAEGEALGLQHCLRLYQLPRV